MEGLLGLDFLIAVAAKIDLGNMTLSIGRKKVPGTVYHESGNTIYAVMLEETLVSKSYSVRVACCSVSQGESLGDEPLMFESMLSDDFSTRSGGESIQVGIQVHNRHPKVITLIAGNVLGYVTHVARKPVRTVHSVNPIGGDPLDRPWKPIKEAPLLPVGQIWCVARGRGRVFASSEFGKCEKDEEERSFLIKEYLPTSRCICSGWGWDPPLPPPTHHQ